MFIDSIQSEPGSEWENSRVTPGDTHLFLSHISQDQLRHFSFLAQTIPHMDLTKVNHFWPRRIFRGWAFDSWQQIPWPPQRIKTNRDWPSVSQRKILSLRDKTEISLRKKSGEITVMSIAALPGDAGWIPAPTPYFTIAHNSLGTQHTSGPDRCPCRQNTQKKPTKVLVLHRCVLSDTLTHHGDSWNQTSHY